MVERSNLYHHRAMGSPVRISQVVRLLLGSSKFYLSHLLSLSLKPPHPDSEALPFPSTESVGVKCPTAAPTALSLRSCKGGLGADSGEALASVSVPLPALGHRHLRWSSGSQQTPPAPAKPVCLLLCPRASEPALSPQSRVCSLGYIKLSTFRGSVESKKLTCYK